MSTKGKIIRIEMEYEDGQVQRLTGADAERWLREVNGILAAQQIRYGRTTLSNYEWEWIAQSLDNDD